MAITIIDNAVKQFENLIAGTATKRAFTNTTDLQYPVTGLPLEVKMEAAEK